jgi:hypothetical protein
MNVLEGVVWIVRVLLTVGVITAVTKSLFKANQTTVDIREWLEEEHQKKIDAQLEWEQQNGREGDCEGRGEVPR